MFLKNLKNKIEYNNLYPVFFTIIFLLILIQYSFNTLDAIFYDSFIKYDLFSKKNQKIVLVSLDEESDQFLGDSYPYSYATHERFFDRIVSAHPLLISYILPFSEPTSEDEGIFYKRFKEKLLKYKNDGNGIRIGSIKDAFGEQIPPSELQDIGYSLAILNKDGNTFARDSVTRRAILNISGEDSFHLWLSNFYRKSKSLTKLEATDYFGSYYSAESDATFSLFKYSSSPLLGPDQYETIPFHRIVVGNFSKDFFKDKIVIIGPEYLSNSADFSWTPFNNDSYLAANLNIHANIVDALISDKTIYQIPDWVSDVISILLSLFLSFIISKLQPAKSLLIIIFVLCSVFLVSYLLFITGGVWIKLSHILLSVFVVYYIWVPFRAIAEYQSRYTIEEEAKMLKKVDNLKQNFISLMSHDLKTPVAKIAGIADILSVQYENVPKQKELLSNIVTSTKELNNFISSILDLTKIESQNLDLRLESKDVNSLIENITDKLRFEATEKGMNLEVNLSPLYPIKIDVVLINRVLSNLVGNAIKYAGFQKTVQISSWDDESWVFIEIKDNGVGIPQGDLENIFDKFYRVKNDSSHQIKGSGLGLYLVKYFIELHNGKISVSSTLGVGTTFLVKLKNA